MPSPCNTDLRWRIIWLVLGMRKPAREVAELLGVTQRTIFNILCGFRRNGNVLPCRIGRPNVMASIARDEAFLLMEYIMRHPGAYLRKYLWPRVELVFSETLFWTPRFYTKKGKTKITRNNDLNHLV